MAGNVVENLKVTHEELINQLSVQLANMNVENTVIKLENQKLKNYIATLKENAQPF